MADPVFRDATADDVAEIVALRNATADALTARHGKGHWSNQVTDRSVLLDVRRARLRIGRTGGRLVTVLQLGTRKPWAIDVSHFTPVARPLYLTNMAVAVSEQRRGLGRMALDDAIDVARTWPADAIRLDAYDGPAGAGPFYERCGFTPHGQVTYRGTPLAYFEMLLG